jgi:hypothetical protein
MTDVTGEMPPELVPLAALAPEATAELDAAPPQVDAPAAEESATETESFDPRISIPESLGPVRRAILEGLIDGEGPMSVSELHALMPVGTPKGTAEAGILREFRSGRIERVSPGVYKLAPPKSPGAKPAPAPEPESVRGDAMTDEKWMQALEAWALDPSSWDAERLGPPFGQAECRIPDGVKLRFVDRLRKRAERRRQADEAAAKRSASDAELRDKLIAATGGNFQPGPGVDDVAPIRAAMEFGVPIDQIVWAIRCKVDKRMYPLNEPASSWREPRLLKEVAENYFRMIVPNLVTAWSAAGRAPAPKVQSLPPAGTAPGEPADASEPPAAVSPLPEPQAAPAVPPPQPAAISDDGAATENSDLGIAQVWETEAPPAEPARSIPDTTPDMNRNLMTISPVLSEESADTKADMRPVVGRDAILAAFARRTPPRPAPPQPAERPWFAGPEAPQPKSEMTDDGWRFVLEGYVVGSVGWAKKHGPPPGADSCRVPRRILKEFGFA